MINSRANNDDIGATLITRFLLVKVVGGVKEFIKEDFSRCSSPILATIKMFNESSRVDCDCIRI